MQNVSIESKVKAIVAGKRKMNATRIVLTVFSALVIFFTVYVLLMPVFAGTGDDIAICGKTEHVHTDACYEEQTVRSYTCGDALASVTVIHTHDANCYDAKGDLVCTLSEVTEHVHGAACYENEEVLKCTLSETAGHAHGDACYELRNVLVCTESTEPHAHGDDCYETLLTCTKSTEPHVHGDSCYEDRDVLTCTETDPAHVHCDGCYETSRVLVCTESTEPHVHGDGCYETRLTCTKGTEPHVHGEGCYEDQSVLICTLDECAPHAHDENCYETHDVLKCALPVCHEHTDACYDGDVLVCTEAVVLRHQHTDACIHDETAPVVVCGLEEHEHDLGCYPHDPIPPTLYCGFDTEHTHTDACYNDGTLICTLQEHTHTDECYDPNGGLLGGGLGGGLLGGALPPAPPSYIAEGDFWTLSPDSSGGYILSVSGTDAIPDYFVENETALAPYVDNINTVEIGADIVTIGKYAFRNLPVLRTVEVASGSALTTIGNYAFDTCRTLNSFNFEDCRALTTIGDYAFRYNAFTEITLPSSLVSIKQYAFCHAKKLVKVTFEENPNLNSLGQGVFSGDSSDKLPLQTINLEALTNPNIAGGNGLFSWCVNLKSLTVPAGLKGSNASSTIPGALVNLIYNDTKLESITFLPNSHPVASSGYLLYGAGVRVLDLRPLNFIYGSIVTKADNLEEIYLPSSLTTLGLTNDNDYPNIASCPKLVLVSFEPNTKVSRMWKSFYTLNSLEELDFTNLVPDGKKGLYIGSSVKSNKMLTRVTLPQATTSILDSYHDLPSLREFYYDAIAIQTMEPEEENTFLKSCGSEGIAFTIGKHVDTLPIGVLRVSADKISDLFFSPDNSFTVTGEGENGLSTPLDGLTAGDYYVDAQGLLYKLDKTAGTATLLYVPAEVPAEVDGDPWAREPLTSCTVSDFTADGVDYTVTGVDPYAFFCAENLASLNGYSTLSGALTDLDGRGFSGVELGNTALTGAAPVVVHPENGVLSDAHSVEVDLGDTRLKVSVDYYSLYTGESSKDPDNAANIVIALDNIKSGASKPARVYFSFSDPGYSLSNLPLGVRSSTTTKNGTFYYTLNKIPGSEIYYLDFESVPEGVTASLPLLPVYPTGTTGGGTLQVWGEVLDSLNAPLDLDRGTDEYQEITWKTHANHYTLAKAKKTTPKLVRTGTEYNLSSLSFSFDFVRDGDELTGGIGKNIIDHIEFYDTLDLPAELVYRAGIADAIRAGRVTSRVIGGSNTASLYVTVDGEEYLFATVTLTGIASLSASADDNDIITLHWTVRNYKTTTEYSVTKDENVITYGSKVIQLADPDDTRLESGMTIKIKNSVDADVCYRYPLAEVHDEDSKDYDRKHAEASLSITTGKAAVTYEKSMTSASYWGEPVTFTLTATNSTAFDYNSLNDLTDPLPSVYYIKPADMAKMFTEDLTDGYPELSIEISHALLCSGDFAPDYVTPVSGRGSVLTSIRNSSDYKYYEGLAKTSDEDDIPDEQNNVLTLRWNDDATALVLDYPGGSLTDIAPTEADIDAALESLHYMPTNGCVYTCQWTYTDDRRALAPQEARKVKIYSTVKDTFIWLGEDAPGQHISETIGSGSQNTMTAHFEESGKAKTKTASSTKLTSSTAYKRELDLNKTVTRADGAALGGENRLLNDSVLLNTIQIRHYGTSSYDVLPIVDRMSGSQLVMVKESENPGASWTSGLETYTYQGQRYFLLSEGEYDGVWLGGLYADHISVTQTSTGLDTLIKWYMTNTVDRTFTQKITYPTYVSTAKSASGSSFAVSNKVWLGDHPTHRLFDTIGVGGSFVDFDKYIVTPSGLDKSSVIGAADGTENVVTYRLRLTRTGAGTITGEDFFDQLPLTYGVFDWSKANVKIVSYTYDSGKVALENEDLWSISDTAPGRAKEEGQFYIVWDESFLAEYSAAADLYIYVELTFPEEDSVWNDYCVKAGAAQLMNTLWFENIPDSVYHNLAAPIVLYLQKGVYNTGYNFNYSSNYDGGPYVPRNDRHTYLRDGNYLYQFVSYYVDLYNEGPGKLYLDTIYDSLPEGFTFLSLTFGNADKYLRFNEYATGSMTKKTTGRTEQFLVANNSTAASASVYTKYNLRTNPGKALSRVISADGVEADYVIADVSVTTETGSRGNQIVKINVTGDTDPESPCTLSYDENVGKWYLLPGQCVRFGYDCRTNSTSLDVARNTVAMSVYNPNNGEISLCDDLDAYVCSTSAFAANDGGCDFLDNASALNLGFRGTGTTWVNSSVELTTGEIDPNLTKEAVTVTDESGNTRACTGTISARDTVNWKLTAYNDGNAPMLGETITDTMPAPFQFTGDVLLNIWEHSQLIGDFPSNTTAKPYITSGGNGSGYATNNAPLFTIKRGSDGSISVSADKKTYVSLTSGVPVSLKNSDLRVHQGSPGYSKKSFTFTVTWTSDPLTGDETLSVTLPSTLGIPAGGWLTLEYSTKEETNNHMMKTYVNQAWLTPVQDFREDVSRGNYRLLDGAPSVYDEKPISLLGAYVTSSKKSVTELDETLAQTANLASTDPEESAERSILLKSEDSLFDYTLTVNGTTSYVMDQLVLIDNLPEIGDHSTFSPGVSRSSAFNVGFAADPNVRVYLGDTLLSADTYKIAFSDKTIFTDDDDAALSDWAGGNADDWGDLADTSRSIRLILKDVPAGSVVRLVFTGRVLPGTGDAAAEPGEIAWNNFGYSYVVKGETLQASPSNVGIRVPSVPTLQKKLTLNNEPYVTDTDVSFSFCVYTGGTVSFDSLAEADVIAALDGHDYRIFSATVPAGASESPVIKLKDDSFWVEGTDYHVVELAPDDDYRFVSINRSTSGTYTFTYDKAAATALTAVNSRSLLTITLVKTDAKDSTLALSGAVFGLYSADINDALPSTLGYDATVTCDGVTYYLAAIAETDTHGLIDWPDLPGDVYIVKELAAPDGYILSTTLYPVSRADRDKNDTCLLNIPNAAGFELPETGGSGITALLALGAVLTGTACAAFLFLRKRGLVR